MVAWSRPVAAVPLDQTAPTVSITKNTLVTQVTLEGFPKGLTTIGAYAFKDCKALKNLTLPKSVTTIGRGTFKGCEVETDT